jgi:hypothetical protein
MRSHLLEALHSFSAMLGPWVWTGPTEAGILPCCPQVHSPVWQTDFHGVIGMQVSCGKGLHRSVRCMRKDESGS